MKYEYRVVEFTRYDRYELEGSLASYGRNGWELCVMNGGLLVFKRQID